MRLEPLREMLRSMTEHTEDRYGDECKSSEQIESLTLRELEECADKDDVLELRVKAAAAEGEVVVEEE